MSTIAQEDTRFNKTTHYDYHILQSCMPGRPEVRYNPKKAVTARLQ